MVRFSSPVMRPARDRLMSRLVCSTAIALFIIAVFVAPALGGQASSGELFFYPCTSCHPVRLIPGTEKPAGNLPNDFQGHGIVLVGHDALGAGGAACAVCHDDPAKNPGMLKLADGTLIDIKGDVSLVCYRCHSTQYKQFKAGTHGKHQASCVAGGCHDPHTPGFIYAGPLMPFVGTGFQFKVLSQRAVFKPLAAPAPDPALVTPVWLVAVAALGFVVAGSLVGLLLSGRFKR
jgi:hypothetical protein